MAINVESAFDVDQDGVAVRDNDGNVLFYIATGSGAPTGAAPTNTWYFRQDTQTLYYKFGALDTDWRQIRADDITAFDSQSQMYSLQFVLDNITSGNTPSVSQTAVYGNGGNTSQNSYIPNQGVPSNIVGVPIGLGSPKIRSVFVGNENIRTGDVYVQQRFPQGTGTWTTVYTITLNNQNYLNIKGLDVAITEDCELAIYTTVSLKNVKVVVNVNGDSA